MKRTKTIILLIVALVINCDAKGGGRGGGGRGGGRSGGSRSSSSRSSSSRSGGGWSWPFSKPSSSYSKPSYSSPSYSSPSYSTSYGFKHSYSSPSYSSPSYSSSYNKPPPAYPGLSHHSVPSYNKPPAYSPSYSNPPSYSYSPSWTYNKGPSYRYYRYFTGNPYGSTFGNAGLPSNTYISNNYYGGSKSSSGFLSNALFYSAGTHHGYTWGNRNSHRGSGYSRSWDEESDSKWRATTKAPYFENKVPGEDLILPAASVVGAATAFGLTSLLPLNVPPRKPLMYCNKNSSEIAQALILFRQNIYQCNEGKFWETHISCFDETSTNETSSNSTTEAPETNLQSECNVDKNRTLECESADKIYCRIETLFGASNIFCNSTRLLKTSNLKEPLIVLNCYEGSLYKSQASFIPTTTSTTAAPIPTTEKSLSFAAQTHLFLLKLAGCADSLKMPEKTTTPVPVEIPHLSVDESIPAWVPEAMTIPPTTTTTTTTPKPVKYVWKIKRGNKLEDAEYFRRTLDEFEMMSKYDEFYTQLLDRYVKVRVDEDEESSTALPSTSTTTEKELDYDY